MSRRLFALISSLAAFVHLVGCAATAPVPGYTKAQWDVLPKAQQERLLNDQFHQGLAKHPANE